MGVTALEVRIRQGQDFPAVSRVKSTLSEVANALDEIDRSVIPAKSPRPHWAVSDMSHDGRDFKIRVTAKAHRDRDLASLLLPASAFVAGARGLRLEPEVPPYFSEQTVTRLLKVAEPSKGVESVSLALVNGVVGDRVGLSASLIDNAKAAIREAERSIGTVTGTLDVISRRARNGVRFTVFDPVRRRTVNGTAPATMVDELREAWGHRVSARGRITRNARGQAIRVSVMTIEVLPDDDALRVPPAALLGVAPDWTGGIAVDEFMDQVRHRG